VYLVIVFLSVILLMLLLSSKIEKNLIVDSKFNNKNYFLFHVHCLDKSHYRFNDT
jgi:hypothetical protein